MKEHYSIWCSFNPRSYIKDFRSLIFYLRKPQIILVIGTIVSTIIIFILFQIYKTQLSYMHLVYFKLVMKYINLFAIFIFLYELITILSSLMKIKKESTYIPNKKIPMIIKPGRIEFTMHYQKIVFFWSDYKEAINLKQALFLMPINDNQGILRFSKSDIDEPNFVLLLSEIKKRMEVRNIGKKSK